eukprot:529829-Rhodomonas_salina.1
MAARVESRGGYRVGERKVLRRQEDMTAPVEGEVRRLHLPGKLVQPQDQGEDVRKDGRGKKKHRKTDKEGGQPFHLGQLALPSPHEEIYDLRL